MSELYTIIHMWVIGKLRELWTNYPDGIKNRGITRLVKVNCDQKIKEVS